MVIDMCRNDSRKRRVSRQSNGLFALFSAACLTCIPVQSANGFSIDKSYQTASMQETKTVCVQGLDKVGSGALTDCGAWVEKIQEKRKSGKKKVKGSKKKVSKFSVLSPNRFGAISFSSQSKKKSKLSSKLRNRVNTLKAKRLYSADKFTTRRQYLIHNPAKLHLVKKEAPEGLAKKRKPLAPKGGPYVAGLIEPNKKDPLFPKITKGTVHWEVLKESDDTNFAAVVAIKKPQLKLRIEISGKQTVGGKNTTVVDIKVLNADKKKFAIPAEIGPLYIRDNGADRGGLVAAKMLRTSDTQYSFILSNSRDDIYRLLKLLASGRWLDIPVKLHDGTLATVTIERTRYGEQALLRTVSGQ